MVTTIILSSVFLGIILLILNHILRKNKIIAFAIFAFLPIILTPLWISIFSGGVFVWLKIYSLIIGALWILLLRFTKLRKKRWAFWVMWGLLIINILEATITDSLTIHLANYLNVLAGLLLILTLDPLTKICIKKKEFNDLLWPSLSFKWIIGYSIWNITFVYLNFPETTFRHVVLLAIPLIIAYYFKGAWIQTRAFTLAIYFMFAFSFPSFLSGFNTPNISGDIIGLILAISSISYMLIFTILELNSTNTNSNIYLLKSTLSSVKKR